MLRKLLGGKGSTPRQKRRLPIAAVPPTHLNPTYRVGTRVTAEPYTNPISARAISRCSTASARALLPYDSALRLQALPLATISFYGSEEIAIASASRENKDLLASLRFVTGKRVRLIEVPPEALSDAIFRAYNGDDSMLRAPSSAQPPITAPTATAESTTPFRITTGDAAQLLTTVVDYAISKEASDLHILPTETGTFIRLRINGTVFSHDKPLCSKSVHDQVISRLKILAQLDTTNHTTPQDGAFKVPLPHGAASIRLGIMPTVHGERAVLRLMLQRSPMGLAQLGLHPTIERMIRDTIDRTEGALICAGPTGSGKTTTLYSILAHLTSHPLTLVSIEDPVELHLVGVSQTQINEKAKLTYTSCLKSVLRHDPDVIFVGEMRDPESATAAMQAAITGHLLLSTVHARRVYEVILRLNHLGIDPLTIGQGVSLILAQRLVPTLCPHCKTEDKAAATLMRHPIYKATGCASCNRSGFSGVALAAEALRVDGALAHTLPNRPSRRDMEALYTPANYISLETSLESLLQQGRIPIETYLQHLESE